VTTRSLRKPLTSHFVATAAYKQGCLKEQNILHDFGMMERNCIFDTELLNMFVFTFTHILKQ